MCFVEPILRLYAIRYLNMYVYSLFAEFILLDTIYLLKFFAKLFLQHNSYHVLYPKITCPNRKHIIGMTELLDADWLRGVQLFH